MKIHFCTFGNQFYEKTKWRLAEQVSETGWVDKIFVYGENDLRDYNKDMSGRGGGYWWWKSAIVKKSLDLIDDNDILLYLDAGCSVYKQHTEEFYFYIDQLRLSDYLGFQIGTLEKDWTKRDLFKFLDLDKPEYTDTSQSAGGIFFLRKTAWTKDFVERYHRLCLIPHLINDDPSYHPNYPGFKEHRHDQSVMSLLVKQLGGLTLTDSTHQVFEGQKPITATRLYDGKI